jgi:hypothetical protein
MIRFTSRQRASLAGTLRELANYGVAALIFGQFVGGRAVSWLLFAAGSAIWIVLVVIALVIEKD